jgi:hypothetical protein
VRSDPPTRTGDPEEVPTDEAAEAALWRRRENAGNERQGQLPAQIGVSSRDGG